LSNYFDLLLLLLLLVFVPLSVCLSVRYTPVYILLLRRNNKYSVDSKRLNVSSNFFFTLVIYTKRYDNIPKGTLISGTSNAGGYEIKS